jgi:hypothetical protein
MSIERHPNLNAAGLCVDVIDAFQNRLRGKALIYEKDLILRILPHIQAAVEFWDEQVDSFIESKKRDTNENKSSKKFQR